MSEAPFRRPSRGGGGGPKGHAPRASAGQRSAGPVGGRRPGFGEPVLLAEHGQSGSWPSGSRPGNRTAPRGDRGRQRSSHRVCAPPTTRTQIKARSGGHPSGNGERGCCWSTQRQLQRPLGVGDAGNGYPASSWTVAGRRSRASAGGGTRQVAANGTAQAARSRAGGSRVLVTTEVGCRSRQEASFPAGPRANPLLARSE